MSQTSTFKQPQTESGKKIFELLASKGIKPKEYDTVSFNYSTDEDNGYILYNYTSTGIHILLKDLDMEDLVADGIKVWSVWEYRG